MLINVDVMQSASFSFIIDQDYDVSCNKQLKDV